MPREIRNRRSGRRVAVPRFLDARVEIPAGDRPARAYRLVDISLQDLCFEVPADSPAIQKGDTFAGAMIRAGHFSVKCHIAVLRTWKQFTSVIHCGARLYPHGDTDQNELVSLVTALESAGKDPPRG